MKLTHTERVSNIIEYPVVLDKIYYLLFEKK